ncbi:MAG TPA: ribbon-helix-helix domain-containing protein [Geobacteraceae bacterium]|nr:ribbon-helix-helix domain-containing protein [Geobacteraceae bacterium]
MQHNQKQYRGEPRKKVKRRKDENVLNNIVSLRISDQEKRIIEKITRDSSRSVSEVVREAIEYWLARKSYCLDS